MGYSVTISKPSGKENVHTYSLSTCKNWPENGTKNGFRQCVALLCFYVTLWPHFWFQLGKNAVSECATVPISLKKCLDAREILLKRTI